VIDPNDPTGANTYIEDELRRRIESVEKAMDADAIVCIHPITSPFDDFIRDKVEEIKNKRKSLIVLLETDGGSIETTERIADVFRHHYPREILFIVPNQAMSAGTILVMSGDRILMDYYSVLGPIDPQIINKNGQYVPALGYLEKFNELVAKSKKGALSSAELAFLIQKFDPAELHRFEQAREHSVDLLKRWLVQYKFKNWKKTETRGIKVTSKMKSTRAEEIAAILNDTRRWRSHGRGLSIQVVKNDLKLVVEDFGTDPALAELNTSIRRYYRLLQDYMLKRGQAAVIHTRESMFAI
jgi:hypothetical protein